MGKSENPPSNQSTIWEGDVPEGLGPGGWSLGMKEAGVQGASPSDRSLGNIALGNP